MSVAADSRLFSAFSAWPAPIPPTCSARLPTVSSSGRSYSTEHKYPDFVLPGTYDAGFNINLMVKDIGCALDLAESTGSPSTVTEVIVEQWRKAAADLPREADHTAIAKWIHEGRGG
jgi:3-hydroxyisobutyrate dehydrogenase